MQKPESQEAISPPAGQPQGSFTRNRQFVYPMLGCILLFTIFYGLCFANGYIGSDSARYFEAADRIARGDWESLSGFRNMEAAYRLGLIIPAAVTLRLAGFDPVGASLYFVLFHLGIVLMVYLIGSELHHRGIGLIAAALAAAWPPLVLYAATPLPDAPCTLLLGGAIYALIRGQNSENRPSVLAWFTLSGMLLGGAATVKQTALFALPVFLAAACFPGDRFSGRKALANLAMFTAGFSVVFGLYLILLAKLLGAPFWGLTTTQAPILLDKVARNPLNPLARIQYFSMILTRDLGAWRYLMAAPFAYPLLFRKRGQLTLAATAIWMFGYHLFGTVSLTGYAPSTIQTRYFLFFFVFSAICSAALIESLGRVLLARFPSRPAVAVTLALFLASGGLLLAGSASILNRSTGNLYFTTAQRGMASAISLASYLAPEGDIPIYVLEVYRRDLSPNFNPGTGSRITLNNRYLDASRFNEVMARGCFVIIPTHDYDQYFISMVCNRNPAFRSDGKRDLLAEICLARSGSSRDLSVREFGPVPLAGNRKDLWLSALGGRALAPDSRKKRSRGESAYLFYLSGSASNSAIPFPEPAPGTP